MKVLTLLVVKGKLPWTHMSRDTDFFLNKPEKYNTCINQFNYFCTWIDYFGKSYENLLQGRFRRKREIQALTLGRTSEVIPPL